MMPQVGGSRAIGGVMVMLALQLLQRLDEQRVVNTCNAIIVRKISYYLIVGKQTDKYAGYVFTLHQLLFCYQVGLAHIITNYRLTVIGITTFFSSAFKLGWQ